MSIARTQSFTDWVLQVRMERSKALKVPIFGGLWGPMDSGSEPPKNQSSELPITNTSSGKCSGHS